MNKILIIGFNFCRSFYNSIILCKPKKDGIEYRITVMNGDMEKQLCTNNTLREIDGRLHLLLSGDARQDQLKTVIARALAEVIKVPLKET